MLEQLLERRKFLAAGLSARQDVAADVASGWSLAMLLRGWIPHLPRLVDSGNGDFEQPWMVAGHLWERGTAKRSVSHPSFLVIRSRLEAVPQDDLSAQTEACLSALSMQNAVWGLHCFRPQEYSRLRER